MKTYTPMINQYLDIKNKYKDCIIFYRLGDFYEMFFEDAILVSKILDLALTKREAGNGNKAPMCGIPYHVVNQYLYKLVTKGYKVAICEQVSDPKLSKGIVKREVIKIVTPGTIDEFDEISSNNNNYIMSLYIDYNSIGITYSDISTSEIYCTTVTDISNNEIIDIIEEEIIKINPSEIIINSNILKTIEKKLYKIIKTFNILCTKIDVDFELKNLKKNGVKNIINNKNEKLNYSLDLFYKYICRFNVKLNDFNINNYKINEYLRIDANSRINLELIKNNFTNDVNGSLLDVINNTKTAMGFRLLKKWISQPLLNKNIIQERQSFIEDFINNSDLRISLEELLSNISDIERLNTKISFGNCNARDLLNLKNSLYNIPKIRDVLIESNSNLTLLGNDIPDITNIYDLINQSIIEDSGISIKDGNIIKKGYNSQLDELRNNKIIGKDRLVKYEISEKENTKIKNLKLIYNKKTGYFFEVTRSYRDLVPDYFILKQTLTNSFRYKTHDLEEIENLIFGSENEINNKEYEIFISIRNTINMQIKFLQKISHIVSYLDVLLSLANISFMNNYCKPEFNDNGFFNIIDGRHPVVEKSLKEINGFISNDTIIGKNDNLIQIITGPNMSGKSTYIRQVALIVILAQIGCFVPAKSCNISIVDKIFTRIGASDNLYKGESTFMVEMKEVNNILRNSTKNSLLIFDEVGRGTSTYDGLSLAWSILEYIAINIGAKTLFATHYHELIDLENKFSQIKNKHIEVYEDIENEDIIFLRKIKDGGINKSYGIAVAKLAGFPSEIIEKAKFILKNIEKKESNIDIEENESTINHNDINMKVISNIKEININKISPVEALNILYNLKNMIE